MTERHQDQPARGSEIILYQTEDGRNRIEVRLENETVWLTQQLMAELFQTTKQNIGQHLKSVFVAGELQQNSVVKKSFTTAADGKQYETLFYNLDAIISVGYRINSIRGTQLTDDIPAVYRSKEKEAEISGYTLAEHPFLTSGKGKELFDAFRAEVFALDECVREEVLKLYVAYKAETNFVDVVPQAKRLRLSINMTFAQIDDPRGLCRDVTNLGRWGNGDVEVGLEKLEDLPYIIGLVRQSLEKQLGEDAWDGWSKEHLYFD